MSSFFNSSWTEVVGYSLLHSLWQGLVATIVLLLVARLINAKYAALRYWFFTGIMIIFFATNIFTFVSLISNATVSLNGINLSELAKGLVQIDVAKLLASSPEVVAVTLTQIMPMLVLVWGSGIVFLIIRLIFNVTTTKHLLGKDQIPVAGELSELLLALQARMGFNRVVQLVQSNHVSVPCVLGHLKPIILLPIGLINGLTSRQVEAILLHELGHIKRHDYLVNIFQSVIDILYFFNPFIWIISRTIRVERENACDDTAISSGINREVYVKTLAEVFSYTINQQKYALNFATKNKSTLNRIQRIMKTQKSNNNSVAIVILLITIFSSVIYSMWSAPSSGQPQFDSFSAFEAAVLPLVESKKVNLIFDEFIKENIIKSVEKERITKIADTLGPEKLKRQAKEYDQAMIKLRASKEYQEVKKLQMLMADEQLSRLKDLQPMMEDAMKLADQTLQLNISEFTVMAKKMAVASQEMAELQLNANLERALIMENMVMVEAMEQLDIQMEQLDIQMEQVDIQMEQVDIQMEQVDIQMNQLDIKGLQNMVMVYAEEAKLLALDAEKIAMYALNYTAQIKEFLEELKPLLIADGYLDIGEKIDILKFKDEDVWVNGKKVKSEDASKYNKLNDKFFDGEDFYMNSDRKKSNNQK